MPPGPNGSADDRRKLLRRELRGVSGLERLQLPSYGGLWQVLGIVVVVLCGMGAASRLGLSDVTAIPREATTRIKR